MSAEQLGYTDGHLEEAVAVCRHLDRERISGVVDEYGIIAQAICDAERRATFPLRQKIKELEGDLAQLKMRLGDDVPCRRKQLEAKMALAEHLRGEGYTYREIAQRLGLKAPSRVHKMLNGGR